jgi:hypothetical protein
MSTPVAFSFLVHEQVSELASTIYESFAYDSFDVKSSFTFMG